MRCDPAHRVFRIPREGFSASSTVVQPTISHRPFSAASIVITTVVHTCSRSSPSMNSHSKTHTISKRSDKCERKNTIVSSSLYDRNIADIVSCSNRTVNRSRANVSALGIPFCPRSRSDGPCAYVHSRSRCDAGTLYTKPDLCTGRTTNWKKIM
jgi:hypothetical protein